MMLILANPCCPDPDGNRKSEKVSWSGDRPGEVGAPGPDRAQTAGSWGWDKLWKSCRDCLQSEAYGFPKAISSAFRRVAGLKVKLTKKWERNKLYPLMSLENGFHM